MVKLNNRGFGMSTMLIFIGIFIVKRAIHVGFEQPHNSFRAAIGHARSQTVDIMHHLRHIVGRNIGLCQRQFDKPVDKRLPVVFPQSFVDLLCCIGYYGFRIFKVGRFFRLRQTDSQNDKAQ